MSEPWRIGTDGVEIALKVTPRAAREAIGGRLTEADGSIWLGARVTAPPADGKANEALLRLLARALAVPVSACELSAGAGSRRKRVRVRGDARILAERLARLAGEAGPKE